MNALPPDPHHLILAPMKVAGSFALGCGVGALLGAPVLLTGAVVGIKGLAHVAIGEAVKHIGKKYNWSLASALLIKETLTSLVNVAAVVTLVALGIIGSTTALAVGGFLGGLFLVGSFIAYAARDEEVNHKSSRTFRDAAARALAF